MFDLVNYFLKKLEFFHHALIVRFISPFYLMNFRVAATQLNIYMGTLEYLNFCLEKSEKRPD